MLPSANGTLCKKLFAFSMCEMKICLRNSISVESRNQKKAKEIKKREKGIWLTLSENP